MNTFNTTISRLPDLIAQTGLSRSTIYLRVSQGLWPKPVNLGGRAVGWPAHEVEAVITALVAGNSDNEIRALVDQLQVERRSMFVDRPSGLSVETKGGE